MKTNPKSHYRVLTPEEAAGATYRYEMDREVFGDHPECSAETTSRPLNVKDIAREIVSAIEDKHGCRCEPYGDPVVEFDGDGNAVFTVASLSIDGSTRYFKVVVSFEG